MSGSVDVRRIRERTEEVCQRTADADQWTDAALRRAARRRLIDVDVDWLCGELSSALDRAEKAEAALRPFAEDVYPNVKPHLYHAGHKRCDNTTGYYCDEERGCGRDREGESRRSLPICKWCNARAVLAGGDTQ